MKCIFCKSEKNGIIIGNYSICQKCEGKILSLKYTTDFYNYFIDRLNKTTTIMIKNKYMRQIEYKRKIIVDN